MRGMKEGFEERIASLLRGMVGVPAPGNLVTRSKRPLLTNQVTVSKDRLVFPTLYSVRKDAKEN